MVHGLYLNPAISLYFPLFPPIFPYFRKYHK